MAENLFVSQIFWPNYVIDFNMNGYLIGWNDTNFRCCIVAIIPQNIITVHELQTILKTKELCELSKGCSGNACPPAIIGEFIPVIHQDYFPNSNSQTASIWLVLTKEKFVLNDCNKNSSERIRLNSLYSCGCLYHTKCYMIEYESEDMSSLSKLVYESTYPFPHHAHVMKSSSSVVAEAAVTSAQSNSSNSQVNASLSCSDLKYTIQQINLSSYIQQFIAKHQKNLRQQHHQNTTSTSTSSFKSWYFQSCTSNIVVSILLYFTWIWLFTGGGLIQLLSLSCPCVTSSPKTSDVSTTTVGTNVKKELKSDLNAKLSPHGIHSRVYLSSQQVINTILKALQKVPYMSLTVVHLYDRVYLSYDIIKKCLVYNSYLLQSIHVKRQLWCDVISFLCYYVIDMCLGFLISYWLNKNEDSIISLFNICLQHLNNDIILNALEWFNNSPMGIKLNPILTSKFKFLYSEIFYRILKICQFFMPNVIDYCIHIISCFGILGISFQITIIMDIITFFSCHISLLHWITGYEIRCHTSHLFSLWQLFQGRKINIFRNRVDSCEFDQNQLMFGTVLFAILFFLFPTFYVYYLLFACIYLYLHYIQLFLLHVYIILKEFSYSSLFLHSFYPKSLTDDVIFQSFPNTMESDYSKDTARISGLNRYYTGMLSKVALSVPFHHRICPWLFSLRRRWKSHCDTDGRDNDAGLTAGDASSIPAASNLVRDPRGLGGGRGTDMNCDRRKAYSPGEPSQVWKSRAVGAKSDNVFTSRSPGGGADSVWSPSHSSAVTSSLSSDARHRAHGISRSLGRRDTTHFPPGALHDSHSLSNIHNNRSSIAHSEASSPLLSRRGDSRRLVNGGSPTGDFRSWEIGTSGASTHSSSILHLQLRGKFSCPLSTVFGSVLTYYKYGTSWPTLKRFVRGFLFGSPPVYSQMIELIVKVGEDKLRCGLTNDTGVDNHRWIFMLDETQWRQCYEALRMLRQDGLEIKESDDQDTYLRHILRWRLLLAVICIFLLRFVFMIAFSFYFFYL